MTMPKLSPCLALSLPVWAAALGGSTTALASRDPGVPDPAPMMVMDTTTVVSDLALLECRYGDAATIDLKVDGAWVATANDILDKIAASSAITTVTSRFKPEPGHEHRMRFKVEGTPTWGPWRLTPECSRTGAR